MTEPFFPQHNEEARLRARVRDTPGDYLPGCFFSIHRLQEGDSWVLCKRGCKGGVGVEVAPELFTTWTSWIHLTISPSHIRSGPAGPQKNPKPVARHSQGSVCKTATKRMNWKRLLLGAASAPVLVWIPTWCVLVCMHVCIYLRVPACVLCMCMHACMYACACAWRPEVDLLWVF